MKRIFHFSLTFANKKKRIEFLSTTKDTDSQPYESESEPDFIKKNGEEKKNERKISADFDTSL